MQITGINKETNEIEYRILAREGNKDIVKEDCSYIKHTSREAFGKIKEKERVKRQLELDGGLYDVWEVENYTVTNNIELRLILEELDSSERTFLFSIMSFIGYEEGILKKRNGEIISSKDLLEISNLSKPTLNKVIKRLEMKKILYKKEEKGKQNQYFINPWIFSRGKRIKTELKDMFKDYKIRSRKNVKWSDLDGKRY